MSERSNPRQSISSTILVEGKFTGIFSGWGETRIIAMKASKEGELKAIADTNGEPIKEDSTGDGHPGHNVEHEVKLGPVYSTAIAGCDLMSSGLYTAGICAKSSGKVSIILEFFTSVKMIL